MMTEVEEVSDEDLSTTGPIEPLKVDQPSEEAKNEPQVGEKRPLEENEPEGRKEDEPAPNPSPLRPRLNINKTDKSIGSHRNRDSKETRCKFTLQASTIWL